ncbi:adhesin [Escherichia coli]|uniref:AfaD n=1 Tax=Escherichia coli TaxID=562 RepID=Q9XDG6_ECOLX|nr:AfaD family invasin [Escherichia coli]AAD44026.1 AfaD [Escherichia coli]EEW0634986.1 adhesin [Escherichia coli]EFB3573143.1 adhesin [Escherichia coli]EFH4353289.1 adhesin [Escherichia coli]EFJ4094349.1 adhesin [Escherichia coli]
MKKNGKTHVLHGCLAVVMVMMAGVSQAAELSLDVRKAMGSELRDGERIATGRIICREAHTGFHVWMNGREDEGRPGHLLIQGKHDSRNEIRARVEGEGWSAITEGEHRLVKAGEEEQAVFDVVSDGRQRAGADEYVLSVSGSCVDSRSQE